MNCFNNNTPNLSASERTQNVRARNLYNAAKQDFQTRGKCRDYAGKTGFYRESGQLRNTSSYCSFLDLNRGYALCVDGAADPSLPSLHDISGQSIYRGLGACGGRSDDLGNPVKLVNGRDNIFNVFTGTDWSAGALLVAGFSHDTLLKGFPVIKTFPPPLLDPSLCCLVDNLLQPFSNEVDVSFNMLNYPALNNDGAGVVIDPSNILFGADFCPTDTANRTQGPNKYLLFAHVSNLVQLSGQLWSVGPATPPAPGVLIKCGDPAIRVGLTVVAGVGIATGDLTFSHDGVTWRNWFMSNYTTAWGIVERLCCGTGPNGEPHWWTLYIKGASGTIAPQELLPLRIQTIGSGNADAAVLAMKGGSGGTGGHFIELGGIWKGGQFRAEDLKANFGKNLGGGGIALYNGLTQAKLDVLPVATMGWRRKYRDPTKWPTDFVGAPSMVNWDDIWTIEPYIVVNAAGNCGRNLLFGNKTKQNYLVSYDPLSKNVRFNINDRLLEEFNI